MSSCDLDGCRLCHYDGCSRKHAYVVRDGNIKIYSDFCVEHTCKYCVFGQQMCRKPKEAHHRFCSIHRKCGVLTCANRGDCPLGVPLPWMCPSHKCVVDGCFNQRYDHYGYCSDHRCVVGSCYERRVLDEEYCVDHVSRLCREENCREAIHSDFRCIIHQRCPVKDCKHWRYRHTDGLWDYCEHHHHEYRCVYKDCVRLCLPRSRYCGMHKCTFEGCLNCRDNEKDVERLFCSEHGCGEARCYAVAVVNKGGSFGYHCRRHTCSVADCREVTLRGFYCIHHSCRWDGCDRLHVEGGTFCEEHECRRAGCRKACKIRLGFCEEHCCKTDGCLNYNDTGDDRLCYEHSRKELFKKIKHLEEKLKEKGHGTHHHGTHHHGTHHHGTHHHDDLRHRYDKLKIEYDDAIIRLNKTEEEIRILRSNWVSDEDGRRWRRDLEERNARLLIDLKREQKRAEHWERKVCDLEQRILELEALLADERLRHPSTEVYERQIADLVRKVQVLEEDLLVERRNHTIHEGRQREIEKLLRTIEELERKLAAEHIRSARVDELIKKLELLQSMLAGEREQKEILLAEIAKRDEIELNRREREDRRRFRRGRSWERRSHPFSPRVF